MDRPLIRTTNALTFGNEPSHSKSHFPSRLADIHLGIKPAGPDLKEYIIKGSYDYYHYMQDSANDKVVFFLTNTNRLIVRTTI